MRRATVEGVNGVRVEALNPPRPKRALPGASAELPFMQHLMIALGARADIRLHRQNVGSIIVRDRTGTAIRQFTAGPPNGAADISGIVGPEGWRLEIETKSATGRASKAQKAWQRMIAEFGGIYVLATFDGSMALDANVARAVALVNDAIAARRGEL